MTPLLHLQRLLGDTRQHTWPSRVLQTRLARSLAELAEQAQCLEKHVALTLPAGTRTLSVPSDHLQTFALVRGTFRVALRLRDSTAVSWWLTVSTTGDLTCTSTAPVGTALRPTAPADALRLVDSTSTAWYLFPLVTGVLDVSTSAPSGTIETRTVQLRDAWGTPWYLTVSTTGDLTASTTGSATLASAAPVLVPLVRLEPEGLQHVDPPRAPGPPRYWSLEGSTLVLDPVPDQTYEAEHWYYTTDPDMADASWDTPMVLHALGQLLPQSQGWAAAQQVLGWADLETAHLARLTASDERDALEELIQPTR